MPGGAAGAHAFRVQRRSDAAHRGASRAQLAHTSNDRSLLRVRHERRNVARTEADRHATDMLAAVALHAERARASLRSAVDYAANLRVPDIELDPDTVAPHCRIAM